MVLQLDIGRFTADYLALVPQVLVLRLQQMQSEDLIK